MCLSIGRAYESSKQQLQSMSGEGESSQVQRLFNKAATCTQSAHTKQGGRRNENSSRKCTRCGKYSSHSRQECLAKDAECRKCNKKGQYAAMCRTKTVVRYLEDEDDNVLGTVTEEPRMCGAVNWHADVQVTTTTHSRSVKFRTDTGADVTVVPDRFFNKN